MAPFSTVVTGSLFDRRRHLRNWLAQDDVEAGTRHGVTKAENDELKALKRRNRELEMENEVGA